MGYGYDKDAPVERQSEEISEVHSLDPESKIPGESLDIASR